MHFTYHRRIQVPKKGRHCWPPTFSTLAPPMDAKYYCNCFIAIHCHSSSKFRIRLTSIAVANSNLFCIFAPPYSMTCIRLWFLNFLKWQTYVNNLSIPYRMPLVASKSIRVVLAVTRQVTAKSAALSLWTQTLPFLPRGSKIKVRDQKCSLGPSEKGPTKYLYIKILG